MKLALLIIILTHLTVISRCRTISRLFNLPPLPQFSPENISNLLQAIWSPIQQSIDASSSSSVTAPPGQPLTSVITPDPVGTTTTNYNVSGESSLTEYILPNSIGNSLHFGQSVLPSNWNTTEEEPGLVLGEFQNQNPSTSEAPSSSVVSFINNAESHPAFENCLTNCNAHLDHNDSSRPDNDPEVKPPLNVSIQSVLENTPNADLATHVSNNDTATTIITTNMQTSAWPSSAIDSFSGTTPPQDSEKNDNTTDNVIANLISTTTEIGDNYTESPTNAALNLAAITAESVQLDQHPKITFHLTGSINFSIEGESITNS